MAVTSSEHNQAAELSARWQLAEDVEAGSYRRVPRRLWARGIALSSGDRAGFDDRGVAGHQPTRPCNGGARFASCRPVSTSSASEYAQRISNSSRGNGLPALRVTSGIRFTSAMTGTADGAVLVTNSLPRWLLAPKAVGWDRCGWRRRKAAPIRNRSTATLQGRRPTR